MYDTLFICISLVEFCSSYLIVVFNHYTKIRMVVFCAQIKALLKDRLNGKATGGSSEKSEKSEPSVSVELNSHNFDDLVLKSKDLWIVEFFAPW